jgi:hypothetical protein
MDATVIRAAKEAPYQVIIGADGAPRVVNHFKIDFSNQDFDSHVIEVGLDTDSANRKMVLVLSNFKPELGPGEAMRSDLFIEAPKSVFELGKGHAKIRIQSRSLRPETGHRSDVTTELNLIGPFQ